MSYTHFTTVERGKLEGFLALGMSCRKISLLLDKHHSSIARELARNKNNNTYYAEIAEKQSVQRRKNTNKHYKASKENITLIEEKLALTWSPEQISNTVLRGQISFKSIYLWIYAGLVKTNNLEELRHKGRKRKGAEKRGIFSNGVSISERPKNVKTREEFGHFEADSMVSSRGESKGVFSTFIERKSRLYIAYLGKDRTSATMEEAIKYLHSVLPNGSLKSITVDRGKEFACHEKIKQELGVPLYFADAYAPWQRGSNENGNGLLREFYPKQTDLAQVPLEELIQNLELINKRPRKCLGWKSAREVFLHEVSHFA